jgi:DNA-binding transcriptional MerR regulator
LADLKRQTYTVGRLAKRFGLSRTALLYYDGIGLLRPSERTRANYRVYSDKDVQRLDQICVLRDAGIPLKDIGRILASTRKSQRVAVLERRLLELNADISLLRRQQHLIVQILRRDTLRKRLGIMDGAAWISLMRAAGLDEKGMHRWHEEFEKLSPASHRDFLRSLGVSQEDIRRIRRWSREDRGPLSDGKSKRRPAGATGGGPGSGKNKRRR